jgi:hypothetical protein
MTGSLLAVRTPPTAGRQWLPSPEKGTSVAATLHAEEQAFARMMFEDVPDRELSNFVATLDHVLE